MRSMVISTLLTIEFTKLQSNLAKELGHHLVWFMIAILALHLDQCDFAGEIECHKFSESHSSEFLEQLRQTKIYKHFMQNKSCNYTMWGR